jgi:nicotinamide mononucleotide (NMN) deamidase PncC
VRIAQRAVIAVAISGVLGAGGLAAGAVAQAAPSGRAYVGCGTNYNHCVVLRRAYIKDGNRVGPIHIGYPGCTAPPESGCANEDWFYVYR